MIWWSAYDPMLMLKKEIKIRVIPSLVECFDTE